MRKKDSRKFYVVEEEAITINQRHEENPLYISTYTFMNIMHLIDDRRKTNQRGQQRKGTDLVEDWMMLHRGLEASSVEC